MTDRPSPPSVAEDMHLGRELHAFRASAPALALRAARGPVLIAAGLALLALQALSIVSPAALGQARWGKAAFALVCVVLGLLGMRGFVSAVLLRLRVHERGFVLRSGEGTRAASWEAVREIRVVEGRAGVVSLGVYLIHGERIDIAEDVAELRAVEACFRSLAGEKFCA